MGLYILKRIIQLIPVLLGVSILCFSMVHLVPGDPVVVTQTHAPTLCDR